MPRSARLPARAADPFASDWAPSLKSKARLIADGAGQAGFQIELAPGSITYWRDPGDAGVPPGFDFSRSVNVASAGTGSLVIVTERCVKMDACLPPGVETVSETTGA